MSALKLTYFNVRGLAEGTRYILAQSGVDYEDFRMDRDMWPEIKPTTPMGQVPVLEHDGKKLCQSTAIARYAAKKFSDLIPENDWDAALADMMVDGIGDLMPHLRPVNMAIWTGDEAKRVEAWNTFKTEYLPGFLDRYESFLKQSGSGYLVGKKLSWADLILAEILNRLTTVFDSESLLNSHPNLAKLMKTVHELPNIKKYVSSRPKTLL